MKKELSRKSPTIFDEIIAYINGNKLFVAGMFAMVSFLFFCLFFLTSLLHTHAENTNKRKENVIKDIQNGNVIYICKRPIFDFDFFISGMDTSFIQSIGIDYFQRICIEYPTCQKISFSYKNNNSAWDIEIDVNIVDFDSFIKNELVVLQTQKRPTNFKNILSKNVFLPLTTILSRSDFLPANETNVVKEFENTLESHGIHLNISLKNKKSEHL